MPLDEGALQNKGLELRVGDDDVEVVDLAHHGPGLFRVGGQIGKILRHPVFQSLGLAHVDDLVFGVLHDVDAGLQRQAVGFFFQFVKGQWDCTTLVSVRCIAACRMGADNRASARSSVLGRAQNLAAG